MTPPNGQCSSLLNRPLERVHRLPTVALTAGATRQFTAEEIGN